MQTRRNKDRDTLRLKNEKATQVIEWLFTGVKSVVAHVFDQIFNIFLVVTITPIIQEVWDKWS